MYGKLKTWKNLFEQHGITYREVNGVFIPNIELPEQKEIGRFGWQHEEWLKEHYPCRYSLLIGSGEILEYLADIDTGAKEMYSSLIVDFAKAEGVDENLKAIDQMKWVQRMESQAKEIVAKEILFHNLFCL